MWQTFISRGLDRENTGWVERYLSHVIHVSICRAREIYYGHAVVRFVEVEMLAGEVLVIFAVKMSADQMSLAELLGVVMLAEISTSLSYYWLGGLSGAGISYKRVLSTGGAK